MFFSEIIMRKVIFLVTVNVMAGPAHNSHSRMKSAVIMRLITVLKQYFSFSLSYMKDNNYCNCSSKNYTLSPMSL